MVTVKISEKDGQQTTYQFDKPEITIGRMKGNDIVLPKGNVSKKHARLINEGASLKVDDLNSTNGTYVNGRKVTSQTEISDDDKIYIGDFILQLQPADQQQSQQGPPSPPGADSKQPSGAGGGPTSPPSPSSSSSGRPKPPSGGSRPGNTGGGTPANASNTEQGTSSSKQDTKRGPSAAGGPSGQPDDPTGSGDADSSLDKRFSSGDSTGGSPSPNEPPSPDSHAGGPSDDAGPPEAPSSGTGSGASENSPSFSPARPDTGDERDRPSMDRAAGGSAVSPPTDLSPRDLTDEFDDDLHELHSEAASALLDAVGGIDELPIAYPAPDSERESLSAAVSRAVSTVEAGSEADRLEDVLLDEATGLGPVEKLLDDPEVDAIYVNDFDRVITRRGDDIVREAIAFGDPDFLLLAAERLLGGRQPARAADRVRFSDGTTARVVIPPVAMHGAILSIECPVESAELGALVGRDALSEEMASFLRAAVVGQQSVLVVGSDDNSRRQVLAALCNELPEAARTVGISEAQLPGLDRPTATQLDATPGGDWSRADVLEAAQRLNPERVVVEELESAEVAGWVRSAVTGAAGSIATIYGQTIHDGLGRLYAAGQSNGLSGGPLDRSEIATAVDIAVLVGRPGGKQTRAVRIAELEDVDYDRFRLNDIFSFREDDGTTEFVASGFVPAFYDVLSQADVPAVDSDIFGDSE